MKVGDAEFLQRAYTISDEVGKGVVQEGGMRGVGRPIKEEAVGFKKEKEDLFLDRRYIWGSRNRQKDQRRGGRMEEKARITMKGEGAANSSVEAVKLRTAPNHLE